MRSKRWLISLAAVGVATIALYAILPAILTTVATSLVVENGVSCADVAVALAGDPRGARERHAMELYKRGLVRKVVVSGIPYAWGLHTGQAARAYVVGLGVPDGDVVVLKDSWNTRREATDLARLMREHAWSSAILVTSAFHSRRALYAFRKAAPDRHFSSMPVPTGAPEWSPVRWWTRRGDMGITVREFLSWGNTLLVNLS